MLHHERTVQTRLFEAHTFPFKSTHKIMGTKWWTWAANKVAASHRHLWYSLGVSNHVTFWRIIYAKQAFFWSTETFGMSYLCFSTVMVMELCHVGSPPARLSVTLFVDLWSAFWYFICWKRIKKVLVYTTQILYQLNLYTITRRQTVDENHKRSIQIKLCSFFWMTLHEDFDDDDINFSFPRIIWFCCWHQI